MMADLSAPGKAIWDAHVHCYPNPVVEDPAQWARDMREPHWLDLVTNGPQGWAGPEVFLSLMDRDGIEKVLLQGWYWENPESARQQNLWHADWVARYPDRFMASACIHPDMEDPIAELESAREWGAVAAGECLPQVQCRAGWAHPAWDAILDWTARAGWPVCLHVTEPVGHDYPGRIETPLMELVTLFEKHPGQKWICAHWGGGLPFFIQNRRVRQALENVWFDSAAGPLLYDKRIWQSVIDLVGAEKVLFGSDFPLLLYPGKETEPGWARLLKELRGCGLAEAAITAVAADNLRQLLG